ncbi:MAG: hypothetical protein C4531_06850 [Desulfurivibrio sp.]|jgi:hypothetical protein|nr:MAG: hypothetical protein C4531_06850 [Desulfurivibrio sp.]
MFAPRKIRHRDQENQGRSRVTGPAQTQVDALPRIRLTNFAADMAGGQMNSSGAFAPRLPDKSTNETTGEQDQNASLTSFAAEARGVGIVVEITNGTSSADYPDGYRWTQTIDTNVPLGGTTSPYVDPRPNDDTKPFYWTDAEAAARPTTFIDHPSRNAPASGTTTWDAVLSLNGVNGTTVTRLDSLSYGFSIDTAGAVSPHNPTSPGGGLVGTHQSTLRSEFPGWTFN